MNTQEYIQSGIIESYVLGLASPEEQAEFERMCAAYPEVLAAREAFEMSLEQHALSNAVTPPAFLFDKIKSELFTGNEFIGDAPLRSITDTNEEDLREQAPVRNLFSVRSVAAAAIILLGASTLLNFYFYNQYKAFNNKYDELLAQQTQLVTNNQAMQTKLQDYESSLDHIRNPKMKAVKMEGVAANPNSLATVYWDTQTKDVYVMVNNLPKPAPGKQYQLWAIVDGKPVDAGMLSMDDGGKTMVEKMKNIPSAQAFAITLEKAGGSPSPTMEAMYVMGKV